MALLNVKTNAEIDAEKRKEVGMTISAENAVAEIEENRLVQHLRNKWDQALRAKRPVEERMIENIRQVSNQYSPQKLAQIREIGGSEIFIPLTDVKANNAIYWIRDILFTKPWGIKPTPEPDVPPSMVEDLKMKYVSEIVQQVQEKTAGQPVDMMQILNAVREMLPSVDEEIRKMVRVEVLEKAEAMERALNDVLTEGGWYEALYEAIWDIVVVKNGFIKGPIRRYKPVQTIRVDEFGNEQVVVERQIVTQYERVSPFDIYPEPDSRGIDDGYLFEHASYRRTDLYDLIGVEGYREDEIRAVLREFTTSGYRDWTGIEAQRAELEGREPMAVYESDKIDALIYWGTVPGRLLIEWGMSDMEIQDPDMDYHISAVLIGNHLIKVTINENKFGRKPYATTSYDVIPDSFWGRALPERVEGTAQACNAFARALVNNISMGSGPQVEINIQRLVGGQNADTTITPWKRWFTHNRMMQTGPAINFWQPNMHAQEIMYAFSAFSKMIDEHSGIPAYAHGDPQVGGGGNTASGLSMLITQAARAIKGVVRNIDQYITIPSVSFAYEELLQDEQFRDRIGDIKLVAMGSSALIEKQEKSVRMLEFLNITNNPTDSQITGIEGRAYLLEEVAKAHDIDPERFLSAVKSIPRATRLVPQVPPTSVAPPSSSGGSFGNTGNVTKNLDLAGATPAGTENRLFEKRGGPAEM